MSMPLHWTTVPLSELVDVLDNKRIPLSASQRKHREGSVPYYGATGQVGTIDDHIFDEPLVLLGEDGVQFFDANKPKAYKIEGPSWVNNHAHVLRPRTGLIEFGYLLHFLNSFDYRGYANGTTRLKLTKGAMNSIPVQLPPIEEQKRIVEQLDVQLYKLEKSRESLLKLKLRLNSLSRSLLHHNVSGNGDLYSLSELCTLITDGSHFSPKTVERGFPYITVRDLQDSGIDFENCKYINEDSFLELERSGCSPKPGDVLFSKDGTVGKVALVSSTEPFVVLSSLAILRPNSSLITPEYLKLSLRSPEVLEKALGMKSGTAIRRVVLRTLKTLEIAVPPLDEQRSIVKFVDAELSRLGSLDNQIEELIDQHENLRRSLLHAAFAGQLTKEN